MSAYYFPFTYSLDRAKVRECVGNILILPLIKYYPHIMNKTHKLSGLNTYLMHTYLN